MFKMSKVRRILLLWISSLTKCHRTRMTAMLVVWIVCVNIVFALLWFEPLDSMAFVFQRNNIDKKTIAVPTNKIYSTSLPNHKSARKLNINNTAFKNAVYIDIAKTTERISNSSFDVIDSKTSGVPGSNGSFVLVIPRRLQNVSMSGISNNDYKSAMASAQILASLKHLDGLTCLPRKLQSLAGTINNLSENAWKHLFNKTWCNYARVSWSVHIRNGGKLKPLVFKSGSSYSDSFMQMCNIVNGPFLLRKETFLKLKGLRTKFGRITMLDFFLRSSGNLKIGKFGGCFYGDELYQPDRGALHGVHDFPEYSDFGVMHGVLRIVMEDRIEWTRCYAKDRLCQEKPYTPPTFLPDAGKPICCSVVLTQMLQAVVAVFDSLGIKYRLIYGTLLGALRSGAIIPYTHDLDFAVDDRFALTSSRYDTLQKYFGDNYTISSNSFLSIPRLLPLLPPYININTAQFFDDEFDLKGKLLFSAEIEEAVRDLIPFTPSNWRTRGYTDFYRGWPVWWNDSSIVQIDGYNYTAMKETEHELVLWYGKNWRTPIVKHFDTQNDKGAVL